MINTRELFESRERNIILTLTREEYDKVIDCLDKAGFTWYSGEKLKEYNLYDKYGVYLCVANKTVTYGSIASAIVSNTSYNSGTPVIGASEIYYEHERFQEGDNIRVKNHIYPLLIGKTGRIISFNAGDNGYNIIFHIDDYTTVFALVKEKDIEKM